MRIATLAAAIALLACTAGVAAGAKARPKTHTVTMDGMRFRPEVIVVARGDTVVWVNADLVPHTATSNTGMFDSRVVPAGGSWKHTVRTKGDFAYTCTLHPTMKGKLRVR